MPKNGQIRATLGPGTALAVAPNTSAIVVQNPDPPLPREMDVWIEYYGMSIGTAANANFATFNLRVNGVTFRTDSTQVGSITTPLPIRRKIGQVSSVDVQGVMAGAAGNTDMAAVVGLLYVPQGQEPAWDV